MCRRLALSIRTTSMYGAQFGFVPCGECQECRNVLRSSWSFRLRVELEALKKQGWQIGFFTLTYNDENIPRLPFSFFREDSKQTERPICFSKYHVRNFIIQLRQWLYRDLKIAKDERLRYMVCSEYGEHTKRPHYHSIVCFPPSVDARAMFNRIHEFWNYGFVFPRKFDGGVDRWHYRHKPFIVESAAAAAAYAAKYCCKDLSFYEDFDRSDFRRSAVVNQESLTLEEDAILCSISDFLPFHVQSKSLGAQFLKDLDEETVLRYIRDGVSFVGSDSLVTLPVYLRNKVFFSNYYIIDSTGKRLCKRAATDFFDKHYKEIFDQKVYFIADKLKDWNSDIYWRSKCVSEDDVDRLWRASFNIYNNRNKTTEELARDYVAYGGVNPELCVDVPRSDFWFSRYLVRCVSDGRYDVGVYADCGRHRSQIYDVEYGNLDDIPKVDKKYLCDLNLYFTVCQLIENDSIKLSDALVIAQERMKNYYVDLFRSVTY